MGDQPAGVFAVGDGRAGGKAAQVAREPPTAVPQKYPHMGIVLPSGATRVVGPALRLMVWPYPVTAAKRRIALTKTAAFSEVLDLKSLIRIMVLASRSVVDTKT